MTMKSGPVAGLPPAPDRRALDKQTDAGRSSTAALEADPAPALAWIGATCKAGSWWPCSGIRPTAPLDERFPNRAARLPRGARGVPASRLFFPAKAKKKLLRLKENWKWPLSLRYSSRQRKGATGFDGDHDARVACRAPGTRKSPETITANQELALAA